MRFFAPIVRVGKIATPQCTWTGLRSASQWRLFSATASCAALPSKFRRYGQTATKEERREFMGVFPDMVRDLTVDKDQKLPDVERWFHKSLQYNVPTGRKGRGLAAVSAYKTVKEEEGGNIPDEELFKALVVGWCVELVHNSFIIQDDLMCHRTVRRGRPAWHNVEGVGLRAVNDALMIENSAYYLLRKYFQEKPWYPRMLDLFHEATLKTATGRLLAAMTYHEDGRPNFEKFTMDRYMKITKFKQSYYTFVLPMSSGMLVADKDSPELHRQAKQVLLEMGEFYQIQDDFLDSFGEPGVTGNVGAEIEDGKMNWLAVVFLQRATPAAIEVFKKNYGVKDKAAAAKVRELYEDLKLPQLFSAYEDQNQRRLHEEIQRCSSGVPKRLMMKYMERLFQGD